MSSVSGSARKRGGRKHALADRRTRIIDAIVDIARHADARAPLPRELAALVGLGSARAWLAQQDAGVVAFAHRLLGRIATMAPRALTWRTHKHEIGACALIRASLFHARAVRDVDEIALVSLHPREQVRAILRSLYARYPAPPWALSTLIAPPSTMTPAFTEASASPIYPHVAQGGRYQDAGLPLHVTRALAHELATTTLTAPRLAIRSAQLAAARVDGRVGHIVACALGSVPFFDCDGEAVLAGFIAFLAREQLDADVAFEAAIYACTRARVDPGFSFAHRTAKAFARIAEREHRWYRTQKSLRGDFPSARVRGGRYVVNGRVFAISAIESGTALEEEGRRLVHCVALYAERAHRRTSTLFRVVPEVEPGEHEGLTVELREQQRGLAIVQAKGFANRGPNASERAVLRAWSRDVGIARL
jgi:hypothetical protein